MSVLILFLFFTFDLILIFLKVAINLPVPEEVCRPLMVISLPPLENTSLSALKLSVTPEFVIRTYLSSSKGKNVSSDAAIIVFVAFVVSSPPLTHLILKVYKYHFHQLHLMIIYVHNMYLEKLV